MEKCVWKRIPRIASALILFSVIRYFYLCMTENRSASVGEFFQRFYTQDIFITYWFLYEYLGILFLLPFLRKMMQNLTEQEEKILFVLILGWNILNDISNIYLGTDFMINLHFYNSISYFILWSDSNVFGIYLIEDYLRNAMVVIWEKLGPYISAIPACCIWLLAVFLVGNVLVAGARRLPLLRRLL